MSDATTPGPGPGRRDHLTLVPPAGPAASAPPADADARAAGLAGLVDTGTLVGEWAAIAERFVTPQRLRARIDARGRDYAVGGPIAVQARVHDSLVSALLHLAQAHTDCTVSACPTCSTLDAAIGMVLAEREIWESAP